ncbi:MAG: S8 family peptidase, partial [Nitrospirota bacterium]|nr:S8 family peptidase [Nitrospirota bacterium]
GEIPGNGLDDDGNGYADDVHGWDFARRDNNPSDSEGICGGHGTHVSGTIGASGNNGVGVTGINWDVSIMPLKVFKKVTILLKSYCTAADSDIIKAINYASGFGVKISSNSYGGGAFSQSTFNAIQASKSIFVAAAGNGGADLIGDNSDKQPFYPASYALSNIISVAATDHNDRMASFSNYGPGSVDLAAPAVNILSTIPGNQYRYYSGTSMASPHVAGALGLLFSSDSTMTVNEGKWRILKGVDPKGFPMVSGGRLNILNSLNLPPATVSINVAMVEVTMLYRGGYGYYSMTLTNQSLTEQQARVSVIAQLPNGREVVLNGPATYTLAAGEVRSEYFSNQVPLVAPLGDYLLMGRAEVGAVSFDEDTASFSIIP